MHALPRSRRGRLTVGVLVVALVGTAWVRRDDVSFLAKLAVPGPAYAAAADRTSDPAPAGDRRPLPQPVSAPGATGEAPSLTLGPLVALEGASALADPPGLGPVLVTTLDGRVHTVDLVTGAAEVVLDLGDRISTGGERGLLGLAVDPRGERLYLDYTNRRGDTEVRSWALDAAGLPQPGAGVLHLEIGQPFENHNGGNLVFGPDDALWIGTGDGGGAGDVGEVAQNGGSLLGKMLRVVPDPDGGVTAPSSNPDWARPEIWAVGLRNPWRYSFDRATRRLWIADVGQTTIEEVTVLDGDAERPNLGWDTLEGNNRYEGDAEAAFTAPVVTYDHGDGCSITGGYVYRGAAVPALYGWYLFGDYCAGDIRAVPADDPSSPVRRLASEVGNVVSFGELDDGELVVLTPAGLRSILPG